MTIKMSKNGKEQFSGIQTRGNCGHLSLVQLACLSGWGEVGLAESTTNASPAWRLWSPKERKLRSFQVPQDPCMIIAFPTVGPEKEMVSSDTY